MISICTYNIQFGKQLSKIIDWYESLEQLPDIICFQEFPETQVESFTGAFNHGRYGFRFASSIKIRSRSYGQLTLFRKNTVQLKKNLTVNLGNSIGEKIIFRNSGDRNTLVTLFNHKKTPFVIANTHLTALHVNKKRRTQIRLILGALKQTVSDTAAQVILGDLNYSSLVRQKKLFQLMEENQFQNAYRLKTHRLLFFHHQLDYVFYKNCKIQDAVVTKLRFSDHYPVQFKLKI